MTFTEEILENLVTTLECYFVGSREVLVTDVLHADALQDYDLLNDNEQFVVLSEASRRTGILVLDN